MNGAASDIPPSLPSPRPARPLDVRGVLLAVGDRVQGEPFARPPHAGHGRRYTGTVVAVGGDVPAYNARLGRRQQDGRGHAPNVILVQLDGVGAIDDSWWSAADLWKKIA